MLYYRTDKLDELEVSIVDNYSESDIVRIFNFIDALIVDPKVTVVFKVNSLLKNDFEKMILKNKTCTFYKYQIQ
jgi:hypothetical protein